MRTLDRDYGVTYTCNTMMNDELRIRSSVDWRLPISARRALDAIIERADKNGVLEISYGCLGRALGVARPHAYTAVRKLIDAGYLVRESAVDINGAPLPNTYRLQLPE
jgi:hypothetical protein